MLRIRVLGGLSIEGSGRQIEPGGSWRARSLLAWYQGLFHALRDTRVE